MKVALASLLALAALAGPGIASAGEHEVTGPLQVAGQGFLRGELTMTVTDETRPVKFAGRGGYIGFLDLGGDMKVRCQGRGRTVVKETEQGKVVLCMGRGGIAVVVGSHFKFRAFAGHYRLALPDGAAGTLQGRFKRCAGDDCAQAGTAEGDEPAADGEQARTERKADRVKAREDRKAERKERKGERAGKKEKQDEKKSEQTEKIPSPAELLAMLTAKAK